MLDELEASHVIQRQINVVTVKPKNLRVHDSLQIHFVAHPSSCDTDGRVQVKILVRLHDD